MGIKTEFGTRKKTFKYDYYPNVKLWLVNRLAKVTNHTQYVPIKEIIVNITCTGLIIALVLFLFKFEPVTGLRYGIATAITLALSQYYIKWYYTIKKPKDTIFKTR